MVDDDQFRAIRTHLQIVIAILALIAGMILALVAGMLIAFAWQYL